MEGETESDLVIAPQVAGKGAAPRAPAVDFDDNSLAKTDSESPEDPNDRKKPEHSTESRVHDQIEVGTEDKTVIKDGSEVASYFGKPFVFEHTPVGFAMGLAAQSIEGLAWYVKATLVEECEGRGWFNVWGPVEYDTYTSGRYAYKVAQRILNQKQPENAYFANSRVHLHMPKAKGPSAGCTMATSLLSLAMKKPVRKDLAMTGEITPTGRILAIGGVKEKIICARQSQAKTIIFPEANRKDIDELVENLKEGLSVHFVDEYEQIFELAFNYESHSL